MENIQNDRTQADIHAKGFDLKFKKVKLGGGTLADGATMNLQSFRKSLRGNRYTDKSTIYRAIMDNNLCELRNISNFYYNLNGTYKRACDHIAFLYRFDWYVTPEVFNKDGVNNDKVTKDFFKILNYLDNSDIRLTCGQIALEVVKNGCYYGYIVPNAERLVIQQLPIKYCRSLYSLNGRPVIEFNMRYFDSFVNSAYRMKVLDVFPDEFKKGYLLYKQGKLRTALADGTLTINEDGWYMLEPNNAVKFNFNNSDVPILISAIPYLLDLDEAQDLDRRRQMQQLSKIIVQKLPRDKNGDLIFDIEEAGDMHNNAVEMLSGTVNTDVLTTFADIDSIDLSDKNASSSDNLEKIERQVFNALGISKNIFNTDGNLSLEKSILSDESLTRNILLQFADFYDWVVQSLNTQKKKYNFRLYMLETTQYNYRDLSKMYKEQTQIGASKMLAEIALGQSQSFVLHSAHFENEILELSSVMIPPLMSSTLNGEDILGKKEQTNNQNSSITTEDKSAGRPEKADDEKSTKTIQNQESMS